MGRGGSGGGGGGISEESPRKQQKQGSIGSKIPTLLLLLTTNLLTFYLSTWLLNPSAAFISFFSRDSTAFSDFRSLLLHLNSTETRLIASDARIAHLQQQLSTANTHLNALLSELDRASASESDTNSASWPADLSPEVKLVVGPHKLPLGFSSNFGSDEFRLPLGSACRLLVDELKQYMTYDVGGECPSDDVFTQRLMLQGCEPLPRRRCHPKSPAGYVEPRPLPGSMWSTPPDTSIVWDAYTCKSYQCLIDRKYRKEFSDCKDCFDLEGVEKTRWLLDSGINYGIDEVLGRKPAGTVRIGLDIGGGTGTFAARMKERNVTVVTSTMNFDGPFNSFVASRGLIPIHMSISHRLPFFDNTLDIVHSMHVLSNWIPDAVLELALFDIYRVLRPGGLFWLDRFFCLGGQMNATYVPMFHRIGFNKRRWDAARKLDRGIHLDEWYISALLEKPMT
ncbi:hypothetical protein ACLOJK_016870 [Asimina triloba]